MNILLEFGEFLFEEWIVFEFGISGQYFFGGFASVLNKLGILEGAHGNVW